MCNLYSHTKPKDVVTKLVKGIRLDHTGNFPPLPSIFPDGIAPVIRETSEGRELLNMRWGWPVPEPQPGEKKKPGYQTNVRQPRWNQWLPWMEKQYRCLVPASSFCEYQDGSKLPTWFALNPERDLFFFAGAWMPWTGKRGTKVKPAEGDHLLFTFLTTKANAEVAPVHSKAMPVLLTSEAARETWLRGSVDEALALQKPAPDGTLKIVATGARQDGVQGVV